MSARVTLTCDATGCRAGLTVATAATAESARRLATVEGWSRRHVHGRVIDACAGCTAKVGAS